MRNVADELGDEPDEECTCEKARDERTGRHAQPKRLVKKVKAEEGKSHAGCPPLVMPSDTRAASNAQSGCHPKNSGTATPSNVQEDSTSDDDKLIWCADCENWFKDFCPARGPLKPDNEGFSQAADMVGKQTGEKAISVFAFCGRGL